MVLQSSIEFIETALTVTGGSTLSYTQPEQKWYILKDLPSLLLEYPSLLPSMDTFTHIDGTTVNLLKAQGTIGGEGETIPITIWVHEGYPLVAPVVFVHRDHPFVDPGSGAMVTPYMSTWDYSRCSLVGLVRNIVRILSYDQGLRKEATERLHGLLYSDTIELKSNLEKEIEQLLSLQHQLEKRAETTQKIIRALMREKRKLKRQALQLAERSDVLINWLRVQNLNVVNGVDEPFEIVGEHSKLRVYCISEDRAIEDTIYALDEALEQRVLTGGDYISQVRMLAREQFPYRAVLGKLDKS